jgi:hypothetical protein
MPIQIVATDSVPGQTLTFSATGLPPGLSISSSGLITGTPTTVGTYNPVITAVDQLGISSTVTFTWFITTGGGGNTITVTNPGNQSSPSGSAITGLQMSATDSQSGQTFTFTSTGLPTGLSINSSGLITGTPSAAGNYSVTVTATDTTSASGSTTFTWTITTSSGNTITVSNPGNQSNNIGSAISLQVSATDSASGQTLTFSATGLPSGLSINASGLISGTITGSAQNYSVTVTATDTTNATGSASFTWATVSGGNTVTVTNPGNQTKVVGSTVSLQISASDSASGQTLSYSATGLPSGLSISGSSGLISGKLTTVQTKSVVAKAVDTTGASGSAAFTYTVSAASTAFVPLVGGTVPNTALNAKTCSGGYASGLTQAQGDKNFVTATGRPTTGSRMLCTKKFTGGGPWSTSENDYAGYLAAGTRVWLAMNPSQSIPSDWNSANPTKTTEYNNLVSFAHALANLGGTGNGFPSTQFVFIFWQEPSGQVTVANYGPIYAYYGQALKEANALASDGKPYQCVADIQTSGGVAQCKAYAQIVVDTYNASPNKSKISLLGFGQDFYCSAFIGGRLLSDSISQVADANGWPFGVCEFGGAPSPLLVSHPSWTIQQAEQRVQDYMDHVYTYMTGRLSSSLPNLDIMWYDGRCSATGVAGPGQSGGVDLTSPLGQDTSITTTPDFRINGKGAYSSGTHYGYQQLFDACSGV